MTNLTGTCQYSTMCGWCTKWDKKCDMKIGCGNEKPSRELRPNIGVYDYTMISNLTRDALEGIYSYEDAMKKLEEITKEN